MGGGRSTHLATLTGIMGTHICMHMCAYMHIHTNISVYIHLNTCIHTHICIYKNIHVHIIYTHAYIYIYIFAYLLLHRALYMCIYRDILRGEIVVSSAEGLLTTGTNEYIYMYMYLYIYIYILEYGLLASCSAYNSLELIYVYTILCR